MNGRFLFFSLLCTFVQHPHPSLDAAGRSVTAPVAEIVTLVGTRRTLLKAITVTY
jgi:hypothetical protein